MRSGELWLCRIKSTHCVLRILPVHYTVYQPLLAGLTMQSGWPPTNLGLHVWIVWLCSTSQTMPLFIT
jgi:hypothetical protein